MTDTIIEDGLFAYLSAQSNITSIVGDRIYASVLPQQPTLPAVAFYNVGTNDLGKQNGRPVLEMTRFQIDSYAREKRVAKLLDKAIRNALILDSYQGVMFGLFGIRVVYALEYGIDDYDDVPDDLRVTSEYEVWHTVIV